MAYIYQIKNIINGKLYVGKTLKTIEERWSQHKRSSREKTTENRPLYRAMNKYGVENFEISILEEVSDLEINEKEKYWIEKLDTYGKGYNATKGGDGKSFIDYDCILEYWNQGKTLKEIQEITSYCTDSIGIALHNRGITKEEIEKRRIQSISVKVNMIDKDTNEIIRVFDSVTEACNFLGVDGSGHIVAVCKGKRKTAYGYIWSYVE